MDGLDNTSKGNFGIQATSTLDDTSAGTGDQDLLNGLFSEGDNADPDSLKSIEEEEEQGQENKKPAGKKTTTTEEPPEEVAEDPDALTNFLLGEENEEEEEEEEEQEEEGQEEQEQEQEEEEGEEEEEEESSISFSALSNELANLGVFNRDEGEEEGLNINSPEEFLQRFKLEKQREAQQMVSDFIGQFGQDYQEAFDAIYIKGVEPSVYFTTASKIQGFKDMDLKKEKNQEAVVRQTLSNQGFEQEDIESEVERLKNYGDLEEVSKKYHKVLVKSEESRLEQEAVLAQQKQQQKQAQKQTYIDNVRATLTEKLEAKNFDGIPLNAQTANELQDFLLVDKWKTESGETLTDFDRAILELKRPEKHADKVKIALLLKLLEKDPTLSTIQKKGVSKQSSQLFKEVARQKTVATRKKAANKAKTDKLNPWFQ